MYLQKDAKTVNFETLYWFNIQKNLGLLYDWFSQDSKSGEGIWAYDGWAA